MDLATLVPSLPHVNATLNTIATVLLLAGWWLIKSRQERAHRNVMLACFAVSAVFLLSYLTYHFNIPGGSKRFPDYPPAAIRYLYLGILASHVILAITVPFLAVAAIYFGLRDDRPRHIATVRYAFPIWLYVSITGVVVYLFLYRFYPPQPPTVTMRAGMQRILAAGANDL